MVKMSCSPLNGTSEPILNYMSVTTIYPLVDAVIICENILTIAVLMSLPQELRTKDNVIIISLATVDLITGIFMVVYMAMSQIWLTLPTTYHCKITYCLWYFMAFYSAWVLTVDGYIAIVYSLHYHIYFGKQEQKVVASILFCWLASFALGLSASRGNSFIFKQIAATYLFILSSAYTDSIHTSCTFCKYSIVAGCLALVDIDVLPTI